MARREYRSAIRSRQLIRDAFYQLLQDKTLDQITVTEIVKRADINRSTFYAHYEDIWSLINEIQQEIITHIMGVLEEMKYTNIFRDPLPFLLDVGEQLKVNRVLFKQLHGTKYARHQLQGFARLFVDHALKSPDLPEEIRSSHSFQTRIDIFVGGIISVYQEWVMGYLDCSIETISQEVARVIHLVITDMLGPME